MTSQSDVEDLFGEAVRMLMRGEPCPSCRSRDHLRHEAFCEVTAAFTGLDEIEGSCNGECF